MFLDIHTHNLQKTKDSFSIISLETNQLNLYIINEGAFSIGIPPWCCKTENLNDIKLLSEIVNNKNVLAIGEIGLDNRLSSSYNAQESLLIAQLLIAERIQKPVILHCVGYYNQLIQIKQRLKITTNCIIHGFRGKKDLAKELIRHGFYLSIGKKGLWHEETIVDIPLNKIFVETDAEDILVNEIYLQVCEIKKIPVSTLKKSIEQNFVQCFKI